MTSLDGLKQSIAALHRAPDPTPLRDAANRAAIKANAKFAAARVPVKASVSSTVKGAHLRLEATGRLTRPFGGGATPESVLRAAVADELPKVREQLLANIKQAFR